MEDQQVNDYNSELAGYNSTMQNYLTKLNEYKQEAMSQKVQNEQMSQYIEGTGLLAFDVVGKIMQSKPFALFTAYVKKSLQDPNSIPSRLLGSLKSKLKTVVQSTLGLNLDNPDNFVWKQAFNAMNISKTDLQKMVSGDLTPLRTKLNDKFIKVVQDHAQK